MDAICQPFEDFALAPNIHVDPAHLAAVPVGGQRQLLFDDHLIAMGRTYDQYPHSIAWTYGDPEKHEGPVFVGTEFDARGLAWLCPLKEGGVYRLWYNTYREGGLVVGYAESNDGLEFRAVRAPGQSDNVVFDGQPGQPGLELGNVFVDPTAPSDQRYKMVYGCWDSPLLQKLPFTHNVGFLRGAASPDGLVWKRYWSNFLGKYCDSQNVGCYDPTLERYVIYHLSLIHI